MERHKQEKQTEQPIRDHPEMERADWLLIFHPISLVKGTILLVIVILSNG